LEDQVAFLLQKYLGNYVRGLNKEALKISVWRGEPPRPAPSRFPNTPVARCWFNPTPRVIARAVGIDRFVFFLINCAVGRACKFSVSAHRLTRC
jgi:hypothetical protein